VANYAKRYVDETRKHDSLKLGISTRGGVIWLRMARAHALLHERSYVIPDDLIALATMCLGHRVIAEAGNNEEQIIESLLTKVDIE